MKVGSVAVWGLNTAVLCALALVSGCVTTESDGSGRGAGARHKGVWKHQHSGKVAVRTVVEEIPAPVEEFDLDGTGILMPPDIVEVAPPAIDAPYTPPELTTESYIVRKGDMLSKLAVKFDTTVATLMELNHLANPDVLYVGQELQVPAGRGGGDTIKRMPANVQKGGSYEIQKGDTLSAIALAANVSIDDLRALNNISNDEIFAGETIYIPSYGTVPSKVKRSAPKKETAKPVSEPVVSEPSTLEPLEPAPLAPAKPAVEPAESAMDFTTVQDHVVYPGESLADIARQYGVSMSEIMRLNNITSPEAVRVNQRLRIPVAE